MKKFFTAIFDKVFLFSGTDTLTISLDNTLSIIKEKIRYKETNNKKLSASDKHLLRNLNQINNRLFAPSYKSVALKIFSASIKPAVISTILFQLSLGIKNQYAPEESIEEVVAIRATKNGNDNLLDLAQYITNDQQKQDFTVKENFPIHYTSFRSSSKIQASKLEPVILKEQVNIKNIETPESIELTRQQNLVKFISGLIAAFRPTLNEPGEIAHNIVELSSKEDFNPFYLAAIISIESRFISNAESNAGAVGLMQIMPNTAREVVRKNYNTKVRNVSLTHPRTNIKLGIDYLKFLEEKFHGNKSLALAAYNWGPANVDSARSNSRRIPGSVQKYASTIIKRSNVWQKHFNKANQIADSLTIQAKNN